MKIGDNTILAGTEKSEIGTKSSNRRFKALDLYALKREARRWAEKLYKNVPITQILLFNYGSKFRGPIKEIQKGGSFARYAIIFEIDADDETHELTSEEFEKYRKALFEGKIKHKPWRQLLHDMHRLSTYMPEERYPQLIGEAFQEVYYHPQQGLDRSEWYFAPKFRNTPMPLGVRTDEWEPREVIYRAIPVALISKPLHIDTAEEHHIEEVSLTTAPTATLETETCPAYSFTLYGDFWEICFDREKGNLRNLKGIKCIVRLIENPNTELYPDELEAMAEGTPQIANKDYSTMTSEQLESEGLYTTELRIENLSTTDVEHLENMIYTCWDRMKNTKGEAEKQKASIEFDKVKAHLSNEYGIIVRDSDKGVKFKQQNRLKSDREKSRVRVTKPIKDTVAKIKKRLPLLNEHLRLHVKTGNKFQYQIEEKERIPWITSWCK